MNVTPEMVAAVRKATCFGCSAMPYEPCRRHPQRDCTREFHGGSRAAIVAPLGTSACPICGKDTPHYHEPADRQS